MGALLITIYVYICVHTHTHTNYTRVCERERRGVYTAGVGWGLERRLSAISRENIPNS